MLEKNPETEYLEKGKDLFKSPARFFKGVVDVCSLPETGLPEIAFAGRSNVGKSSLINAITGVNGLARASNMPGRTQELNFFELPGKAYLVDLPGYGFAAAPKKVVQAWTRLIHDYLRGRVQLKRVFLLIDSRHGIKKTDENVMKMLDGAAVTYQIILTKADKLPSGVVQSMLKKTQEMSQKHVACYPEVLMTSAPKRQNIDQVQAAFYKVLAGI